MNLESTAIPRFAQWLFPRHDKGTLVSDRGTLVSDKGTLVSDRGTLVSDRGTLVSDKGTLVSGLFPSMLWPALLINSNMIFVRVITEISSNIGIFLFFGVQNPVVGVIVLVDTVFKCFFWRALFGRCILYFYPQLLDEEQVYNSVLAQY